MLIRRNLRFRFGSVLTSCAGEFHLKEHFCSFKIAQKTMYYFGQALDLLVSVS